MSFASTEVRLTQLSAERAAVNPNSAIGAEFVLVCPTMRDERELSRLYGDRISFLRHTSASTELENIASGCGEPGAIGSVLAEVDALIDLARNRPILGVISTDDYPGSTVACIVAERLGLSSPSPAANLLCQHKYQSRLAQATIIPEAVPRFASIDITSPACTPPGLALPFFVKPVKSFFSIGAHCVTDLSQLASAQVRWSAAYAFFEPFRELLESSTDFTLGTDLLLAEELLHGCQVTLEGYAYDSAIHVLGVVDSVMYPGTLAFERFEYPSSLPRHVQGRMADLSRCLMEAIGYRDGMFNIEFIYDPDQDRISLIEVNPRMASQFADLYEKVDGFNSYEILLAIAAGREPQLRRGEGVHRFAASCVLRTFEDAAVAAVPSAASLEAIEARFPDVRIDILVRPGHRLSDEMQDDRSYRYATFNLGGKDREDLLVKLQECRRLADVVFQPALPQLKDSIIVADDAVGSPAVITWVGRARRTDLRLVARDGRTARERRLA